MSDGPMIHQSPTPDDEGGAFTSKDGTRPQRDDDPVPTDDKGFDDTATRVVRAAPFENFNKEQMVDHLNRVHGYSGRVQGYDSPLVGPGTKATKDQLSSKHDELHRTAAPLIAHEHVPLEESSRELAEAAANGEGIQVKLTATEIKRLTQVVNNDFAGVKAELEQFASDMRASKTEEVDGEFKTLRRRAIELKEKIADFRSQATRDKQKIQVKIRKLQEKQHKIDRDAEAMVKDVVNIGNEEGIEFNYNQQEFTLREEKASRNKAIGEINEMLRSATLKLEKQRLSAQRIILLSGISSEGDSVLSSVPDARTLMQTEQAKAEPAEIEGTVVE